MLLTSTFLSGERVRVRATHERAPAPMNPLVSDRFIDFLLADVLDLNGLLRLPGFEGLDGAIAPWFTAVRRVAREVLFPSYKAIDETPPKLVDGRVILHPKMHDSWRELVALDAIGALRDLPHMVTTLSSTYLMAGNLAAYGVAGLTAGAVHLIEAFGTDDVKSMFVEKMRSGAWTGTMALTEPQAGSSLNDVTSRAKPMADGTYRINGSKIFISGGDQDLTSNVVHLVLARIDGAPAGTRGISLFAVPRIRNGDTFNDVHVAGVIHKIGWRGLPSLALNFGEEGDCHGWLVGPANQGLKCMFQMMNEARLMVGANAAATASVAFHQSVEYALDRKQGRPLGVNDATTAPIALIEHPDVRRMLLRQKAIVEGALALLGIAARFADVSSHHSDEAERTKAKLLLDLLTPIAKTFPSEKGFESNALALQIHGGYGYSSEYLPEAWLRDQKLNSIHEGTTTIQGLDLLGRKVIAGGGAAFLALQEAVLPDLDAAQVDVSTLKHGFVILGEITATLSMRGSEGDVLGMLGHSADFLEGMSTLIIGWVWVRLANATGVRDDDFAIGLRAAASYWLNTEVPLAAVVLARCRDERSYLDVPVAVFSAV